MVLARGRGISGAFRKCQTFGGNPASFRSWRGREKAAGTEPAAFCPAEAGISGRCSRPRRQPGAGERESAGFSGSPGRLRDGPWGWQGPVRGISRGGRTFRPGVFRKDRAKRWSPRWDPKRGHSSNPESARRGSGQDRRGGPDPARASEPAQRTRARCRPIARLASSSGRSRPRGRTADGEKGSSEMEVSGTVLFGRSGGIVFRDVENYSFYRNYQAKIVRRAPIFSIPCHSRREERCPGGRSTANPGATQTRNRAPSFCPRMSPAPTMVTARKAIAHTPRAEAR